MTDASKRKTERKYPDGSPLADELWEKDPLELTTRCGRFGHDEAWRTRMAKSSGEADSHETPWVVAKYWITIASVIASFLVLAVLVFDGVVWNGQCTFLQHITFVCNRWDGVFKPWDTLTY